MSSRDVVSHMLNTFGVEKIDWARQIQIAKSLLSKYSYNEIVYALNYYKNKGERVFSLGFLSYKENMKYPLSLYKAECNTQDGDSGERNWNRIKQIDEAECGEDYPRSLFEEPTVVN